MIQYRFWVHSPSDPHPDPGLGYHTLEQAEAFAAHMNHELENFNESKWNMVYWKKKPEPFIVTTRDVK